MRIGTVKAVFVLGLAVAVTWQCNTAAFSETSVPAISAANDGRLVDTASSAAPSPQGQALAQSLQAKPYAGSRTCRDCHQKFYELWSTSHHGLAMQPYTDALSQSELTPQKADIIVDRYGYRAFVGPKEGWIRENGPEGERKYTIAHVMGGKNVYFFLTPLERGRLQTLPVAYDVTTKTWYDTTKSMLRHFSDQPDSRVDWRDPMLTFNTSCYGCHVSQLSTNYDEKTDSYHSVWAEPGINCEACHGPATEHVQVFSELKEGQRAADPKIISTKKFSTDQLNHSCAVCHAKAGPISQSFRPGDRFFDHFNLVTLESPDYYADGRDLGENYTFTSWLMSPCVKSVKLDCLHCHTSSGRYRFEDGDPNASCLPCHEERVEQATEHTHHPAGSPGNKCVSCHMPMTNFAKMKRSDHSMKPPAPALSLAFGSPNACNICHQKKSAKWADNHVRKWRTRDFQKDAFYRARLIDQARKRDWSELAAMFGIIGNQSEDEVLKASLIRLLAACPDERKWPALQASMADPSPLVRAASAEALSPLAGKSALESLLRATNDDFRLVRIRAAATLAQVPREVIDQAFSDSVAKAAREYEEHLRLRPDQWHSHFNMGNYLLAQEDLKGAIASYDKARALRRDTVFPLINSAIAYSRLNEPKKAEEALRGALGIEPKNPEGNYNLGLLLAEKGDKQAAKRHLQAALDADPRLADASYNLGLLSFSEQPEESLGRLRAAYEEQPGSEKYAYGLAFHLMKSGAKDEAVLVLSRYLESAPSANMYMFLGSIYENAGDSERAREVLKQASEDSRLPSQARDEFSRRLSSALTGPIRD